MVRTVTSPAKEDEQDLSKVTMQFSMFEALVRGYLASADDFLTKDEKEHLVFSGKLMTFGQGIRFLTDLEGDACFKVGRDEHNLTAAEHNSNYLNPSNNRKKEWIG